MNKEQIISEIDALVEAEREYSKLYADAATSPSEREWHIGFGRGVEASMAIFKSMLNRDESE